MSGTDTPPHAGRSLPGDGEKEERTPGTDIHSLEDLEKALRLAEFPLIGRITQNRLWISVRTLLAGDEEKIAEDFKTIGLSM